MKYPNRGTTCVKVAKMDESSFETHNKREIELDYLLPPEYHRENWDWEECSVAEKRLEIEQRYREHTANAERLAHIEKWRNKPENKSWVEANPDEDAPYYVKKYAEEKFKGQKMQANSQIFREAILVFDKETTFDEIKECCKALDQRFGFKTFQISAHRDEGVIDAETGEVKYNLHAHLGIDWTNQKTGINLQGHRIKKKTESNFENKKKHRAKFLERKGTNEETVANNKKKMSKSARAKLEKKQTPIVFDSNDPSQEWHLKQSKTYDYFKMGLFAEDFALMQDVASETLKMNRGQVKGKKGIAILKWKAEQAQNNHDKKMAKLKLQEKEQKNKIDDLTGDIIRISADLKDLHFQKQEVVAFMEINKDAEVINEELLNDNDKLVNKHNQLQNSVAQITKEGKEMLANNKKLANRNDLVQSWIDECDEAKVPTELVVDGETKKITLDERTRTDFLRGRILNYANYIFRKSTWISRVNDIIGGTKNQLTKAQRTFDVFLWFNPETKNLNIHKEKNKVKLETQELPIKFGEEQKPDPTAPEREKIPQRQTIREQQKIVQTPTQNKQTKISV
jgi:hypothetical protein